MPSWMCSWSSLISRMSSLEQAADDLVRLLPHLGHQLVRLGEAARDQLRRGRGAVRERRDDDQHAVLGEVAPVAQRDVGDVADAEPVDEGHARLDVVGDAHAVARQLDDVAVLGDHDRGRRARPRPARAARGPRASGTRRGSASSAFGRSRPSSVRSSSAHAWPETCTGEFSSCSTSAPLRVSRLIASWTRSSFPGTGARGHDHGVAALDANGRVVVVGDPRQRRERLALRAGAEDQLLARVRARRGRPAARGCRPAPGRSRGCARC